MHILKWKNGEGNGTPFQSSCLENPMDGGAWWGAVHGVAKSWKRLSNSTFTFDFHALEKEMATHSSVLAWRILGTAEPGGLLSMGSHRVRHDWSDLAAAAAAAASERSQSEMATHSVIPTIRYFGKGKIVETVKEPVVSRGSGGGRMSW